MLQSHNHIWTCLSSMSWMSWMSSQITALQKWIKSLKFSRLLSFCLTTTLRTLNVKVNYQLRSTSWISIIFGMGYWQAGKRIGGHYYESALLLPGNMYLKPWTDLAFNGLDTLTRLCYFNHLFDDLGSQESMYCWQSQSILIACQHCIYNLCICVKHLQHLELNYRTDVAKRELSSFSFRCKLQ